MASSIVYRCWPTEFNTPHGKETLDSLGQYPLYATTREGLVKHLVDFLSEAVDCDEDGKSQMRKEIKQGLDILGKSYEGRHGVLTVNRIAVAVPDPMGDPGSCLNLYLEIAELH
jgi:hypothetical protein